MKYLNIGSVYLKKNKNSYCIGYYNLFTRRKANTKVRILYINN